MRILVTGATGTIGREAVTLLAARGTPVRAASRHPGDAGPAPVESHVEHARMDLRDPQQVGFALEEVDRVLLITPLEEEMTALACTFVAQAAAAGVQRLVRLSAFGADGARPNALGRAHRAVERVVEASSMAWTLLRPNAFMQNFVTEHGASIRAQNVFRAAQGRGRVSMVDARDVAAVAVAALVEDGHAGVAYELTGPEALSNERAAELISAAVGRRVRYEDVAPARVREALEAAGLSAWVIEVVLELYAMSAAGEAARVSDDLRGVLGREPIAFADFVEDYRAAFEP